MPTNRTHRPPCPLCREPVAREDTIGEATRCPHCSTPLCFSVPFGSFGADGFREASPKAKRGHWTTRTDHCGYCRTDFPFGTVTRDICDDCRNGKARRMIERYARQGITK